MRWTDLPAASPVRTLGAWRDAQRTRGPNVAAHAESLFAQARAGADGPLVLVEHEARATAMRHVRASALERGGLLVGTPVAAGAADGPVALVHVTRAVASAHDDASPLALRMDAAVWTAARAALGADETVVGWFHSHPGIGAFFSDTDRRTQAAFFAHRYSVAWVVDPVRGEHAWFAGARAAALPAAAIVVAPRPDAGGR